MKRLDTAPAPLCGRQFAARRLALGITQGALARELGVFASTLARREASDMPLDEALRTRWQAALQRASARRMRELHKLGLKPQDMPRASFGALLVAYADTAGGDAA